MWWKNQRTETTAKAVAYYRHSAQDRQENSVPIQREQVRRFASDQGIEIIREFADHGKSGLSTEGRDSFNEMLRLVRDPQVDFKYVLVLDVSRWGRFQDVDMSAYYRGYCKKHGREVIYTSKGMPRRNDPLESVGLVFEGYRAAEYSRELSDKVFKGCVKIAEQGYRAGGMPPYGFRRLLLDENRRPVQVLKPGQRKSIQNQRVTLTPGDKAQVTVVRRIFAMFVRRRRSPETIADTLNREAIPSPGGSRWAKGMVRTILTNEIYIGTMVYNKTSQKLQARTTRNPTAEWVRTPEAFEGIVDKGIYEEAQKMLEAEDAEHRRRHSPEGMLEQLKRLVDEYGIVTANLVSGREDMLSPSAYAKRFRSLDRAYQALFADVLERTREMVTEMLRERTDRLNVFDDYLVLNDSFSVVIQPSVPVPRGYRDCWAFRPDPRVEVDITLGVPLSNNGKYEILGYVIFPRMLVRSRNVRLFSTSQGSLELHGHTSLKLFDDLLA